MPAAAEQNFGNATPNPVQPFTVTPVATFDTPWAIAFLPDGHMLITEKPGKLYLVSQAGSKQQVTGVPKVHYEGQEGLLDVAVSPHFATDRMIYLSYAEPGAGGSGLAVARGRLIGTTLAGLTVIWRQLPKGKGGQDGGVMTFDPSGQHLFLAVGERMRFTPAQDPNQSLGKILRLTLDGKPAPGNPGYGKTGTATVPLTDPPRDTVAATDAPARQVALPDPNLTPAETWSSGHRNPYGLAFDAKGALWEVEMGPKGGDELNIIKPGRNYGWPVVSNGINYDGAPIPKHDTHPAFEKPVVYWTPVIAPAGFAFYDKGLFPQWKGSAFIGGLRSEALIRIAFGGANGAREADRWDMGHRIRDVAVGPDGALWLIEDEEGGRLLKLTPKT
ncbi:PQQ-dependent sugar dehydrogenase [Sphingomonas abietis]|uniref:PQQ-dependent sugar dehydrogenase n=1 Tax=Sphingomonas abietis TaxID=3012344 RepID=A0ABY7NND7_9SPHN|nr:PQQ-dependent sugar dehydrogenase [Sphingomonas abietis]WBO23037.1 PQQ-dependent sugar dehydrogenase [Sphingomonas abietis]